MNKKLAIFFLSAGTIGSNVLAADNDVYKLDDVIITSTTAVLDVTNKEGYTDRNFSLIANVNIANANIVMQGKNPLNIPGSWIVSARRTYYDLILAPFARRAGLITEDSSFPSFEDIQFKIALGPYKKSKFVINGIFSKDGVDIVPGADRTSPDSVNVNDVTSNNVLAVGWHYNPNPEFYFENNILLVQKQR